MNKLHFILLALSMPFFIACNNNRTPEGWSTFKNDVFSIAYPQSMEVNDGNSKYRQDIQRLGLPQPDGNTIIFQQRGLNNKESESYTQYIRVMVTTKVGSKGDFLKANENYGGLPSFDKFEEMQAMWEMDRIIRASLFSIIQNNCRRLDGTYSIVEPTKEEEVEFNWRKIGNGYSINTHYVRNREIGEGQVRGEIYLLHNDSQVIVIVAACPNDEYDKTWSEILHPMIHSFRWTRVFK